MKIYPNHNVLEQWEQLYVPKRDIFFISEQLFQDNPEVFLETLNFKRKLFFQHSEYNTLHYNNFYGYWNIEKSLERCIVALPGWYERLNTDLQLKILNEQIKSKSYAVVDNAYVMTNKKWEVMTSQQRHDYFISTIETLNENEVLDIRDGLPEHVKALANTYSVLSGSNCFGVVLYTITKSTWFLNEWVYAENLIWTMEHLNYTETNNQPGEGDILIWYQDDIPFHAAICVGNDLYLNKNSQMIWSPTKLVNLTIITNDFEDMQYKVFSKE